MAGKKYKMPRRSEFRSQSAYERARAARIRQIRKKRRRLRALVKSAIIAVMVLVAGALCMGLFFGVTKLFSALGFGGKSVRESILAERYEVMPDLSTVTVNDSPEEDTPSLDVTVCIDPGHGGMDPGTSNTEKTRTEKEEALDLGLSLKEQLEDAGVTVVMTRDDDSFPSLSDRTEFANSSGADYYISIHRNAVENSPDSQGVEIYTKVGSEESLLLGNKIMDKLKEVGISSDRGVKPGSKTSETSDFQVNRDTQMPSCLLELGFMTNAEDNQLYDEHLDDYAKAIKDAVVAMVVPEADSPSEPLGAQLTNAKIMDVDTLDNSVKVWGPGAEVNENNVPTGVVSAQEEYGSFQTLFYKGNAGKEIFLTFDVGYEAGYTEQLLDTLKSNDVHAVFFITLPFAQSSPDLVQRMIDEGHIVGNHSATYPEEGLTALSVDEQKEEIEKLHEYMLETFNYQMTLFRFPNGRFSEQSLAVVNNLNYASVFWSFAYGDYDQNHQPDATEAVNVMTDCLHSGAIYLLSANSQTNANVLNEFIDQVKTDGFVFSKLSVASNESVQDE